MNPTIQESVLTQARVEDRAEHPPGPPVNHQLNDRAGPRRSVMGRLVRTSMMAVVLVGGAVFGLYKMRVDIPALNTPRVYAQLDALSVRAGRWKEYVTDKYNSYFHKHEEAAEAHQEHHKVLVTRPMAKDVTITQDYVCQIHSRRHVNIRAMEDGYLEAITVSEGQAVKTDDLLFSVRPVLYKARLAAEVAERDLAQLELNNTKRLAERQGVSPQEVKLFEARLARAQAKVDQADAELKFASVRAPFDGIIDRLHEQQGSLVKEGDILTTLSDNRVMWVYFNVTEKRYLEYMAETGQNRQSPDIELVLANHTKFPQIGKIGAIEANFDNETGNIAFRADFPNPDGLLRHGQTGKIVIHRALKNATVIPQRATFENLAKRYVYVIGKDDVAHQREIVIDQVLDDIFVIGGGIDVNDDIVFEGVRQIRDGDKVEYERRSPEEVMKDMKNHAE